MGSRASHHRSQLTGTVPHGAEPTPPTHWAGTASARPGSSKPCPNRLDRHPGARSRCCPISPALGPHCPQTRHFFPARSHAPAPLIPVPATSPGPKTPGLSRGRLSDSPEHPFEDLTVTRGLLFRGLDNPNSLGQLARPPRTGLPSLGTPTRVPAHASTSMPGRQAIGSFPLKHLRSVTWGCRRHTLTNSLTRHRPLPRATVPLFHCAVLHLVPPHTLPSRPGAISPAVTPHRPPLPPFHCPVLTLSPDPDRLPTSTELLSAHRRAPPPPSPCPEHRSGSPPFHTATDSPAPCSADTDALQRPQPSPTTSSVPPATLRPPRSLAFRLPPLLVCLP